MQIEYICAVIDYTPFCPAFGYVRGGILSKKISEKVAYVTNMLYICIVIK
ncbi:TPA_asm: hypothetical protein [Porphyromonas phage phage016a_WW2866]|uniref:Uncharacterized protein n=1 Tax=Porphyromonas phage phage016a_WW2866 TaxID=3154106 RepID=A0AAT9J8E0_9CAUD